MTTPDGSHRDSTALREQIDRITRFYSPDRSADSFTAEREELTGDPTYPNRSHLVAASRFVVTAAIAVDVGVEGDWRATAAAALDRLWEYHYDRTANGFDQLVIRGGEDEASRRDRMRSTYGHAFCVLAAAHAVQAGAAHASGKLETTLEILDDRFYEPNHGLYRSDLDEQWEPIEAYRGQNANMHACEAHLAAYDATGSPAQLQRAIEIAERLCVNLAAETDGLLWEHYTPAWEHDFAYNRSQPADQFRPWGFQPGHHAEWARLLATIDARSATESAVSRPSWAISRAEELFEWAMTVGWNDEHGGFYYTIDRNGEPIVTDTYGWTVAEAIGAATLLFERTDRECYRDWYDRLWTYADEHLVAPRGNWYERVNGENERLEPTDGPAVEPGYHPIGACAAGVRVFG